MRNVFLLLIAVVMPSSAKGEASPFGTVSFDRIEALGMLDHVAGALASFRALTGEILGEAGLGAVGEIMETTPYVSIHPSILESVGYTGWEEQNIGFVNWPLYLRGVIESQQLRILELERRVAGLEGARAEELEALDSGIEEQSAVVEELAVSGWVD